MEICLWKSPGDFPRIELSRRRQGAPSRIRAAPRQVHGRTQGGAGRYVVATDHDPWKLETWGTWGTHGGPPVAKSQDMICSLFDLM